MLLSTASQYAITGVLRLTALPPDGFCRVDDLIAGTQAPRHAVGKVFYELAKRRILESVRGIGGGYRLSPGVGDLTLMDLVEAVDGPFQSAALTERGLCEPGRACPLETLLQPVADRLQAVLRTTRIRDLAAMSAGRPCCSTASSETPTGNKPRSAQRRAAGAEVRHEHEST